MSAKSSKQSPKLPEISANLSSNRDFLAEHLNTRLMRISTFMANGHFGIKMDLGICSDCCPAECIGTQKHRIEGEPDLKHVSTSYIERSSLTMRMHNGRFTRLTYAFSKKFESHVHMVAIWTVWYNWVRIHKSLRVTPAMASNLTDTLWTWDMIVAKMDEVAPKPGRPKTYINAM